MDPLASHLVSPVTLGEQKRILKNNCKNLTVQKRLTGSVYRISYIMCIYIYISGGGGGPPGPKMPVLIFFVLVQPYIKQNRYCSFLH